MNISTASSGNTHCTHVSIERLGDLTWGYFGSWYEEPVFDLYSLVSTDARGNAMYHTNIRGIDMFITKDMLTSYWMVSITILHVHQCIMGRLNKFNKRHKTLADCSRFE